MSAQPISIQQFLEGVPVESSPESGAYLVSVRSGVIRRIGYSSLVLSPAERAANGEVTQILGYLTELGDFTVETLALIEEKRAAGWPDYSIHIRIMGTSTVGLGSFVGVSTAASVAEFSGVGGWAGLGSLTGLFVSADAAEFSGIGIAIGLGSLAGISGATSVAEGSGVGIALGIGSLDWVQTASSVSDFAGIGIAAGDGIGAVTGVLATLSVAELLGAGISLGIGALAEVVVGTSVEEISGSGVALGVGSVTGVTTTSSVEEISGSGETIILGIGALTEVSAVTSVAEISGTGVALGVGAGTGVTVASEVAEISGVGEAATTPGIADLTGVTISSSTEAATGVGVAVGIGAATGVTATASVGSVDGVGAAGAPDAPSAPTLATASSSITPSWGAVSGATSYNVYWKAGTAPTATDGSDGATKITGATSGTAVTGLTNGTTYYFCVTAVNASGESALSASDNAVPNVVTAYSYGFEDGLTTGLVGTIVQAQELYSHTGSYCGFAVADAPLGDFMELYNHTVNPTQTTGHSIWVRSGSSEATPSNRTVKIYQGVTLKGTFIVPPDAWTQLSFDLLVESSALSVQVESTYWLVDPDEGYDASLVFDDIEIL